MKLFPKREFVVETTLSEYEVVQFLEDYLIPKETGYSPNFFIEFLPPDESETYKFSIRIYYNILGIGLVNFIISLWGNFIFYPKIKGEITGKNHSRVCVGFKYPVLLKIMFYWGFTFIGVISSILIVDSIKKGDVWGVIFVVSLFLFFQVPYFISAFLYKRSFKNIKDFLMKLLEAK